MVTFNTASHVIDDHVLSTAELYVERKRANLVFESAQLLRALFGTGRQPGVPGEQAMLAGGSRPGVKRVAGRTLIMPVATGSSTNSTWFRGGTQLSTNIDDVGTRQKAIYAYITEFAGIWKTESWENAGVEKKLDLFQDRVDQAFNTLTNTIETALWSTNTDTTEGSQEAVMGIQHIIDPTPTTGTCWDLNRANITQHRNQVVTVTDTFANVGFAALDDIMVAVTGTSGVDKPSVHLTTSILCDAIGQEMQDRHQLTTLNGRVEAGASDVVYKGVPIVYNDLAASGTVRTLNYKYLRLFMQPGADFKTERQMTPPNQALDKALRIYTALQWGATQHRRQGVITGFTNT